MKVPVSFVPRASGSAAPLGVSPPGVGAAGLRGEPLTPVAAVATGPAARRLGERLLCMDDAALSALAGIAAPDLLLVLGETGCLPWADGTTYLGYDPEAPRLLLPTALAPDVPVDLLERAVFARVPGAGAPLAVLANPRRIVAVAAALRVERARLLRWMDRWA